jgi:thiamine kinase
MKVEAGPQSVLATLPGWEHAVVRELRGGLTNRSYLLRAGARRAVLKIDASPRTAPFNRREDEARLQTIAAGHGLASPVLYANDHLFMTEYLHGEVWSGRSFASDDNLEKLAGALRKLHGLPLTGRAFDAGRAALDYAGKIAAANSEQTQACLQVVESMPSPRQLRVCHNDLVAANIIATPELRFLDWEYACDNDPLFDLATVVAHHRLSSDRADLLLDHYFDGDGARWREPLAAQQRLYDALHWLWRAARPLPG